MPNTISSHKSPEFSTCECWSIVTDKLLWNSMISKNDPQLFVFEAVIDEHPSILNKNPQLRDTFLQEKVLQNQHGYGTMVD